MEKVEKWMIARDEESWLDEYNKDENRYSASRGAYKNLKCAERARVNVNKITALVELLMAKTKSWEHEKKKLFLFDKVPLLAMLEEYNVQRLEKEEEKQKQREKKKAQGSVEVNSKNLRCLNGGFGNGTPPNGRLSLSIETMNSNGLYLFWASVPMTIQKYSVFIQSVTPKTKDEFGLSF